MKTIFLKLLLRIFLVLSLIFFIFFWQRLSCLLLLPIFLFILWAILYEVFTYLLASKFALLEGLLKDGSKIKTLLSGRFFISIKALIISIPLTLVLLLGLSATDNILFFLSFFGIFIFVALLLLFKKISNNEFSFGYLYTKRWIFILFSSIMVLIYALIFILTFNDPHITTSLFEYMKTLSHNPEVECLLCKDMHVGALYFEDIKLWFFSKSSNNSFLNSTLLLIFMGMFTYFFALSHLYSYILHIDTKEIPKKLKPGLFITTLLTLSAITLTLFLGGFIKSPDFLKSEDMQTSHTEEAFRFVFGSDYIDIPLSKIPSILQQMDEDRVTLLSEANTSIDKVVNEIFDEASPKITQEMANWYFSVLTDYSLLLSWATTNSVDDKVLEEFEAIFKKHFPKDLDERLLFIKEDMDANFNHYLSNILKEHKIKSTSNNLTLNIITQDSLNSLQTNSFKKLSYSAGITSVSLGVLGTLSAKSSMKLASKIAAKVALKGGAAATGGGVGLSCGPFAVICSPLLAIGTWIGVDYAITKLDESLNREDFEADISESLNIGRQRLKADLNSAAELYYNEIYQNLSNKLKRI